MLAGLLVGLLVAMLLVATLAGLLVGLLVAMLLVATLAGLLVALNRLTAGLMAGLSVGMSVYKECNPLEGVLVCNLLDNLWGCNHSEVFSDRFL